MLSEALSRASSGLKVFGLPAEAIVKRPPCWPFSALDTRGEGGRGWEGLCLPHPAGSKNAPKQRIRANECAVIVTGWCYRICEAGARPVATLTGPTHEGARTPSSACL